MDFIQISRIEFCAALVPARKPYCPGFWLDACTPFRDKRLEQAAFLKYYTLVVADLSPREQGVKKLDLQVHEPILGKYHVVTSTDTLEHIPDYLAAIRSLKQYLASSGILILSVPSLHENDDGEHTRLMPVPEHFHHCWQFNVARLRKELVTEGFAILGEYTNNELDIYRFGHFFVLRHA